MEPIYPSGDSRAPTPPPGPASVAASVNRPIEGLATVAQLDRLSSRFETRLLNLEQTLAMSVENAIFVRTQEYLSERYEDRMMRLKDAVEGLRTEVTSLQEVCSRLEAARLQAEVDARSPNPIVGVGSAPTMEPQITLKARDSPAKQEQVRSNENEDLRKVVNALTSSLRQVNERLDGQVREPTRPHYPGSEPGCTSRGGDHRKIGTQGGARVADDVARTMVHTSGSEPGCTGLGGDCREIGSQKTGNVGTTEVWTGDEYPGLEPLQTLQNPFVEAVSYRTYRLRDTRQDMTADEAGRAHKKASHIRGAFPHLANFSGRAPSKLLSFLKQFQAACDNMGIHEGLAVRVVSFFLEEEAYRFYGTLASAGLRRVGGAANGIAWPQFVHRMLKRYCTEDVLSVAYDKVARATQKERETEGEFADRILDAAIECGDVFDEKTLVNHFVSGLLPSVRYSIAESVLQRGADIDLSVARRMAVAAGETHRAQRADSKPISRSRTSPRTMVVERHPEWVSNPSSTAVSRLPLMILPTSTEARDAADSTSASTEEGSKIVPEPGPEQRTNPPRVVSPPTMSDSEAQIALKMMTNSRGGIRCWGCREDNHNLYNCPYLPWEVRMLFAKANYDYQAEPRGPAVADSHFRMRGSSPARRPYQDGGRGRRVTIASPPNVRISSPHSRGVSSKYLPQQDKRVLVHAPLEGSLPSGDAHVEVHPDHHSTSSTSSGN